MAPVKDEYQWNIVHQLRADGKCQDPGPRNGDPRSSKSIFTLAGGGNTSEYVTANELPPGNSGLISSPNSASLSHLRSPSHETTGPHQNMHGAESLPRTNNLLHVNNMNINSPTFLDQPRHTPRSFHNFQETDLAMLFPQKLNGKSPSNVGVWVQRCERSGAGLPYFDTPQPTVPTNKAKGGNAPPRTSNTRTITNNDTQYGPGLSRRDRPGSGYRQIDTQPQNSNHQQQNYGGEDSEDETEYSGGVWRKVKRSDYE